MHNTFTTPQSVHAGIAQMTLQNALRCCLVRLSRGIYTLVQRCPRHGDLHAFIDDPTAMELRTSLSAEWTPAAAERVRSTEYSGVLGTYRQYDPADVIGGTSAAVVHGIPLVDERPPRRTAMVHSEVGRTAFDPRVRRGQPGNPVRIEVWNPRRSHSSRWIVRRRARLHTSQVTQWRGRPITTRVRTCVDIARLTTVLDGLVAADWLLADSAARFGRTGAMRTREALEASVDLCARMRGTARAREAIRMATGKSESVAESLALFRLCSFGITDIRQQVRIDDGQGRAFARVDFLLRAIDGADVIVEVDGLLKYRSAPATTESREGSVLIQEKHREDRLRRLGYRVVRLTWADLWDLPHMRVLLREACIPV